MLVNNYDNSLKESVENDSTFTRMDSPKVFIRDFECRIKPEDNLIINFAVCDPYEEGYYTDDGHNNNNIIVKKETGRTFTTIITFDEYEYDYDFTTKQKTPTSPLYNKQVKLNTYYGEQSVDVNLFELAGIPKNNSNIGMFKGEHYFSIKCIQDIGCGSAVQFFHFLVEATEDEYVLDLTTTNHFTVDIPIEMSNSNIAYTASNATEKPRKISRREWSSTWDEDKHEIVWQWVIRPENGKTIVFGRYDVTVNQDNIKIVVSSLSNSTLNSGSHYEIPSTEYYANTPPGYPKLYDYSNGADGNFKYNGEIKNDITGTYYLYYKKTVNNKTYNLADYVDIWPDYITTSDNKEVLRSAIMNKVALNRLMEAAKQYAIQLGYTRCKLVLPKGKNIVLDRHKLYPKNESYSIGEKLPAAKDQYYAICNVATYNNSDTQLKIVDYDLDNCNAVALDYFKTPPMLTDSNGAEKFVNLKQMVSPYMNMWEVSIPNNFTLDLNGSTISVLQSRDIISVPILAIQHCNNSHVINGKIFGAYRKFKKLRVSGSVEHVGNIAVQSSIFSTFRNIEDAYSQGYDLYVGGGSNNRQSRMYDDVPFNTYGYINNEGQFTPLYDSNGNPRTEEDAMWNSDVSIKCNVENTTDQSSKNAQSIGNLFGTAQDIPGYAHCISRLDSSGGGVASKGINSEMFLHLYRSAETNLDDVYKKKAAREFIKTMKVYDTHITKLPKEIHSCILSSWGIGLPVGKQHVDSMNFTTSRSGKTIYKNAAVLTSNLHTYCCGFIDCYIHDIGTCYCDAQYCTQCFYKDCVFVNIAAERQSGTGGYSAQITPMDIEDEAQTCTNLVFKNCENVIGRSAFLLQNGLNIGMDNLKGWAIINEKQLGGYVINSATSSVSEAKMFTYAHKYNKLDNIMTNKVIHSVGSDRGWGGGCVNRRWSRIENSTLGNVSGNASSTLYYDNCKKYN